MKTLKGQFILSHILPILLVVPITALALVYILETQVLLGDLSRTLKEEAYLIADFIKSRPEILFDEVAAETFLSREGQIIRGQIALIQPDGDLLAGTLGVNIEELRGVDFENALEGEASLIIIRQLKEEGARIWIPLIDINHGLLGVLTLSKNLDDLSSSLDTLRRIIVGTLGVELFIAACIGLLLALRLERPIRETSDAILQIAEEGSTDEIKEVGPREMRALAATVNYLTRELSSLEALRNRMLANVVHELGRPLGAIQSAIHAILQGAAEDGVTRDELLQGMDKEIQGMQILLEDLTLIKGQLDKPLKLSLDPLDLSAWLISASLPWRSAAQDKGITWTTNIPKDLPTISLDPHRMSQALGNLLSNAIKYTAPEGEIDLSAGTDANEVWISVKDTGVGISLDEQDKVFEPFYRSTRERRFPQGLGLGLTIARELIDAHGGELKIESAPEEGTIFTITIPVSGINPPST
jgi:signal transduction histidine kinase